MIATAPGLASAVAAFAQVWAGLGDGGGRVGLAVSGGPDSMALLLLAFNALGPEQVVAATVDHGLRAGSADEAAMVAKVCAANGIAHTTLGLSLAPGAGVQDRARQARYRALGAWCREQGLAALATAHHTDDQAETVIMRLNRGAGLRGLAAMRDRARVPGHDLPLLRPLLGWRRADLAALVADAGWPCADDPSNRDARFERVRVRQGLAMAPWIDPAALAASAAHLAEADAALDWMAERIIAGLDEDPVIEPGLPRALMLRVLERVIARLGGSVPRGRDLAAWHDRLAAGEIATLAGVRGDGRGPVWRFAPAAPHRRG